MLLSHPASNNKVIINMFLKSISFSSFFYYLYGSGVAIFIKNTCIVMRAEGAVIVAVMFKHWGDYTCAGSIVNLQVI